MYWDEYGEAAGAMPELLNAAAKRAGIRLRWVDSPGGAMVALKPGSGIDIWPIAEVHEERRKLYHLTQPFARSEILLVRRAEDAGKPIQRLAAGNRPGISDWVRREHAGAVIEVRDPFARLTGLCSGALDAAVVEAPALDSFLMNQPDICASTHLAMNVLPDQKLDFAIASSFPAADAADLLRHQLGEMARDDTLDSIFQRYYPLAHYRSADTFAETETERSARMFRWSAATLLALCGGLWISMHRLRRRADEAMATAEQRTRFLATISHELRTPLNGVLGIATALASTELDHEQQEYVRLIRGSGELLVRGINEVLDFFRLEAGKHSLAYAPVDLKRTVEGVISILAPLAQQKGLELTWAIEESVASTIHSDDSALRQILMNLVGNGLKFTTHGGVGLRIGRQQLDKNSAILRITVNDSGPGIPVGREESIFLPFDRGDARASQSAPGTGLGLSITKQLVLLMGGTIRAANRESGGSTFTVDLPLMASIACGLPAAAPLRGTWHAQRRDTGKRAICPDPKDPANDAATTRDRAVRPAPEGGVPPVVLVALQQTAAAQPAAPPGCASEETRCEDCILARPGGLAPCLAEVCGNPMPPRALVVDDNPVNRRVLTALLQALGVSSDTANDGEEALSRFSPGVYNWIIMDWQMPRMDGLTALQRIRERDLTQTGSPTPAILCSASEDQNGTDAVTGRAFEFVLIKPISIDSLRKALVASSRRRRNLDLSGTREDAQDHPDS
ncbi:MAG: response regulator, partial [Bryobacterales bacterium]|nr:response regulator [Bryobacterales bacterium]